MQLQYYDDDTLRTRRGGISLKDITEVSRGDVTESSFFIMTGKRKYSLDAPDSATADAWVTSIQAALKI